MEQRRGQSLRAVNSLHSCVGQLDADLGTSLPEEPGHCLHRSKTHMVWGLNASLHKEEGDASKGKWLTCSRSSSDI